MLGMRKRSNSQTICRKQVIAIILLIDRRQANEQPKWSNSRHQSARKFLTKRASFTRSAADYRVAFITHLKTSLRYFDRIIAAESSLERLESRVFR